MKSSGLFRIGRDAELRYLPDGKAVANISIAYNFGKKGQDGSRPTQWIDAAIFGQRAETLAPILIKGSQHVFHLSEVHIETFTKQDGSISSKLAAFIDDVELTDRRDAPQQQQAPRQQPQRQQGSQPYQAPRQAAPQQRQQPARQAPTGAAGNGFDDMDDDIPFATNSMSYDMTTSKAKSMARYDY